MRTIHSVSWFVFVVVLSHRAVTAEEVIIPLADFLGVYGPSDHRTLPIDAGVAFSRITGACIEWQGEGTAGYAWFNGEECWPGWWVVLPVGFRADLRENGDLKADAVGVLVGETTYPAPEPFDTISNVGLDPGETWEFLLDGQCDLSVGLSWPSFSFCSIEYYDYPSGTLDAAQLVIVGMRPGDFDGDGDVDLDDRERFGLCFTGPGGGPVSPVCQPGDFDEDDDIDCADWSEFELAWTEPDAPPEFEPCHVDIPATSVWGLVSTVLLLMTAGTVLLGRSSTPVGQLPQESAAQS